MELEIGAILDGKVTGITKFGAFVALPGGRSGLVHISEIAYSYVSDVSEFLEVGQDVKVKLIGVDESGRINLSIKKTTPPPPRPAGPRPGGAPRAQGFNGGARPQGGGRSFSDARPQGGASRFGSSRPQRSFSDARPQTGAPRTPAAPPVGGRPGAREPQSFEDKLKQYLSESESRLSDLNRGGESRRPRRNRRG